MHETEDTEIKTEPLPRAAGHLTCALASPGASSSPSLSQSLQPGWLLFPEPLPPLGTCRVLLILRPQPEALLGSLLSGSRQLWACLGLRGTYAAPGLGRQPCDCKLSETELVPTLCSVHLLEQRRFSSPREAPAGVRRRESAGDVWPAIVLLGRPVCPQRVLHLSPTLG